jgi:NADH-quinone oxidoreductase subunit E
LRYIARQLVIPASQIFHISTFYKAFSLKPKGKHICNVCLGTACHVRGAPLVLEELERKLRIKTGGTTEDGEFSLDTVNCLGACALGPLVTVDGEYFGNMSTAKVNRVLRKATAERKEATKPAAGETAA